MKITKLESKNLGCIYLDSSPLKSKLEDDYPGPDFADVEGQFRFWLEYKNSESYYLIGYNWPGIKSSDINFERLESGEISKSEFMKLEEATKEDIDAMIEEISKLTKLPEGKYTYRYTGDIGIHSNDGSQYST